MTALTIIRGLPGSGKSTLANQMAEESGAEPYSRASWTSHVETDMYWLRPDRTYDFNARLLSDAHDWCFTKVTKHLSEGYSVVVSNTFTTWREMERYVEYALTNGHELEVITMTEEYGSVHDVPESTMEKMRSRMESHNTIMEKVNGYRLGD